MKRAFNKIRNEKLIIIGLTVTLAEIFIAAFLPMIMKLDPYSVDNINFGTPPGVGGHILGTDSIGRDVLARLIYGGRVSIFVGFFSTLVSLVIGVPLGLYAAYYRGIAESIIMRITDIFMAFPGVILVLVAVALVGPSVWSVSVIIGIMGFTGFTRLTYSRVLTVSRLGYVEGAKVIGAGGAEIIWKYVLPNSMAPILVSAAFNMSSAILTESALSFLGMGVQPPQASWGNIIFEAQSIAILIGKPWQWVPAGIAIIVTVISINFLGDGLRDALDPKAY